MPQGFFTPPLSSFITSFCHPPPFLHHPLPFPSDNPTPNAGNRPPFLNSSHSNMTTGPGQDPGGTHTFLELLQRQESIPVANAPKPAAYINGPYFEYYVSQFLCDQAVWQAWLSEHSTLTH